MLLYQNLHSYYWLANSRLFGVETEGKKGDWIVKAVCKKSVHYVSSTGYEETLGGGFGQIVLYSNSARVKKNARLHCYHHACTYTYMCFNSAFPPKEGGYPY